MRPLSGLDELTPSAAKREGSNGLDLGRRSFWGPTLRQPYGPPAVPHPVRKERLRRRA